jgi:putative ABC transport system permease protein
MLGSFDGLAIRQLRTRRLRSVLTTFGIVLGVGMVFGVLTLTGTIRSTFDDVISSAWGSKDLIVTPAGGGGLLREDMVERARAVDGVKDASGMAGGAFIRLNANGRPIKGTGGRLWVAGYDTAGTPPYDFQWVAGRTPASGPELGVERNWARDHGVHVGQLLRVGTPAGPRTLPVVGVFRFADNLNFGGQGMAAMPIGALRSLAGIPSGYHQISITAGDRSQVAELQRRVQAALGPGADVRTPQAVSGEIAKQLQALDVVLYFFAGVALFVGGFLILNAFNMTVLQRTRELGMLRTLGATRRMVKRTVLAEALVLGLVGSVLGLGLGLGLAVGLTQLMKGFGIPVGTLSVGAGAAVVAVITGLVATFAGAYWPARRAGRISPIRAVLGERERGATRHPVRRALIGLALFVPGLVFGGSLWMNNNTGSALNGILGMLLTMAMFVGMVLAAPVLITPLVRALTAPLRRLSPTGGRMASDATRTNSARTAATAIALTIGLSVVVVNSGLSSSFLGTLRTQIDQAYLRDATVQPYGAKLEEGGAQTMEPSVRREVAALPGAGVVTPLRITTIKMPTGSHPPGLALGIDPAAYGSVDHSRIGGATRAAALAGLSRGGVMVSGGYARGAGLHVGDSITLRGPSDTRRASVSGIYDGAQGAAMPSLFVSLTTMRDVYGVTADAQLLLRARSAAQRSAFVAAVDRLVARRHPELETLSTAEIKRNISNEISRQFGLFNAILYVAIVVSLLGVVNTLAMSVAERTREIGLLRALGASRWLVRLSMLDESLLITASGAIAGVGLGLLIAWSWVQSLDGFIPGITFHLPVAAIVSIAVAAVVLGSIAAALPARRAARLNVIEALSYE